MADTPRRTTRSYWLWLVLIAAVVLAAVIWWSATRSGEDSGGSISMGDSTAASAQTAQGASEAVPVETQRE